VYLLPSLMTLGNLFCGYACVIYAMRGEYAIAAPFIGVAMVLDTLDGRIARLTGTTSEFGLQFDSLADIISFGIAPAILTFSWGLTSLGNWGWAAGFVYVTAAAMRLARFNIQAGSVDKRYFVGMPSPAAATVPASTIFAYPSGFQLQDVRSAGAPLLYSPSGRRAADCVRVGASCACAGHVVLRLHAVGVC
jgi:CDP-diacylglycerol--serine O-phosphatidyltransferase